MAGKSLSTLYSSYFTYPFFFFFVKILRVYICICTYIYMCLCIYIYITFNSYGSWILWWLLICLGEGILSQICRQAKDFWNDSITCNQKRLDIFKVNRTKILPSSITIAILFLACGLHTWWPIKTFFCVFLMTLRLRCLIFYGL